MAKKVLVGVGAFALLIVLWFAVANNQLVNAQENVTASWSQVETSIQRRYDLIPNLVSTVKGYAEHEKSVFEDVTRARSQWAEAKTVDEKAQAATAMREGIGRLMAVAENYPDLKASQNFRDLQVQLEGTENRISVERQRYNDAVRDYNVRVRQFPSSIVAGMRGFQPSTAYFNAEAPAKEAPKVQF
jgi:LemA protein